jgi:hypothetical protein
LGSLQELVLASLGQGQHSWAAVCGEGYAVSGPMGMEVRKTYFKHTDVGAERSKGKGEGGKNFEEEVEREKEERILRRRETRR